MTTDTAESPNLPKPIFVVSDSTGDTAATTVRAALAQFDDYLVNIKVYSHVTEVRKLQALMRLAAKEHALVVFTLVKPKVREELLEAAAEFEIPFVDLIGAPMRSTLSLIHI